MKTADFFVEKAKGYINSIDELLPSLTSEYSFDGLSKEQEQKVSDLRLKSKVLFSEFDKGEVFYKKLYSLYW